MEGGTWNRLGWDEYGEQRGRGLGRRAAATTQMYLVGEEAREGSWVGRAGGTSHLVYISRLGVLFKLATWAGPASKHRSTRCASRGACLPS